MGKRDVLLGMALVLAGLACGPTAAQSQEDAFYRQRIMDARTAAQAGADARADPLFDELIEDPAFGRLPEDDRRRVLSSAAWSAARNGRTEAAAERYRQLATIGSDDADDWYRMTLVAIDLQDLDAAARAMTTLVGRWPELLDNIEADLLHPLAQLGDTSTPDRIALLQALFDANWKGGSAGAPGGILFLLARARLQQGDLDRARAAARRIEDPNMLISMRSDRRFDALLDHQSWRANVSHANAREIERARTLSATYPDRLEPLVTLGYQLLLGGRHEEVVALTDTTLARIAAAPLDSPPFTDLHQQVWLMNYKSIALQRMERVDEAVEELRRASRLGSGNGGTNVSQALNLGTLECERGNARSALAAAALAGEDAMSPYGRAVRASIRQCAALQLEDAEAARAALDELFSVVEDAPVLYLTGLLQAERADDAAEFVRDQLDSETKRSQVLDWAQNCRLPPPLSWQAGGRAQKKAFLGRRDVLDAIEAVGRIESYDVYCHEMD